MDQDTIVKKAKFINESVQIRTMFDFASPFEVMRAIKVYCSSFYGCMLWDLGGEKTNQIFNAWNTAVKLVWGCPRTTRKFLVQRILSCGLYSARTDILGRYSKFVKSLKSSPSDEIRILVNIVSRDVQSNTGRNMHAVWIPGVNLPERLREQYTIESLLRYQLKMHGD